MNCKCENNKTKIIPLLQKEMKECGYISKEAIQNIAKQLNVSEAEIYGVATFYAQFKLKPNAKHNISVCTGTACFVLGAEAIVNTLAVEFGLTDGGVTDDGMFELHLVRCLGCCGLAPVVSFDGNIMPNATPLKVKTKIQEIIKEGK